jgi:hypothetical protein
MSVQQVRVLRMNVLPLPWRGGGAFFRIVTTYVPNYTAKLIVTILEFFASNAPKFAHPYKSIWFFVLSTEPCFSVSTLGRLLKFMTELISWRITFRMFAVSGSEFRDRRLLCIVTYTGGERSDFWYRCLSRHFSQIFSRRRAEIRWPVVNRETVCAKVLSFRAKPRQLGCWTTGGSGFSIRQS